MTWAFVTGGARGLGAEICLKLAKRGYFLVIHYNTSDEGAAKLMSECESLGARVHLVQGNFNTQESTAMIIGQVLKLNVPIKILINNVGSYLIKSLLSTSAKEWCDLFQINVHAPFFIINKLSDQIIHQKGSVINIGVAGLDTRKADTYSAAYSITKQALLAMTKSLAKELAPHHVNVNMISPGYLTNSIDLPEDLKRLPMKRAVELSEVADMVEYLLSDSAKNITGQNIEISGGVRI